MFFLHIILLAIALSIDGFGVGLAYGIKKVRITLIPILFIAICSAFFMSLSIVLGYAIADLVSDSLAGIIGGIILISIGLFQLIESRKSNNGTKNTNSDSRTIIYIKLKTFGIILQVLRDPEKADMDKSGEISLKEATLLGVALNVDAIGVGFGAGIAGYSLVLVPTVAVALFVSLLLGLYTGKRFASTFIGKYGYILPGIILIMLGSNNIIPNIF